MIRRIVLMCALAWPSAAHAYFGISGRTAGMGGTGIAVARGGEGIYYNPARIVTATTAELSLSANAYGFERTNYAMVQAIDDGTSLEGVDLAATSILSFPSVVSTVVPIESGKLKHVFGAGVFVPFSPDINAEAVFTPSNHPTVRRLVEEYSNREYWMSGSYGLQIGALSVGATLVGVLTTERSRTNLSRTDPGFTPLAAHFFTQYTSIDGQAFDLHAAAGAHLALGPISLAAMVRSPSINVAGLGTATTDFATSDAGGNYFFSVELADQPYANPKPMQLGSGIAYATRDFTFTVEGLLDLERTAATLELKEALDLGRGNMVTPEDFIRKTPLKLNVAAGAEVAVSPSVTLRAGTFAIFGFDSIPTDDELDAINALDGDPNRQQRVNGAIGAQRRWSYAATLGFGYRRSTLQTDVALTGVLIQGEAIRPSDAVFEGGDYFTGAARRDISGYALIVSIGGTYGLEPNKEDDR